MSQAIDPYEQFEREVSPRVGESPDGPLFHYTTSQGLVGILETRKLRATHYRHLNDTSEIVEGTRLVMEVASELTTDPTIDSEVQRAFHSLFRDLFKHLDKHRVPSWFRPFIVSFSELGNQLSQWRAYGDDGNGYSLGILLASDYIEPNVHGWLVKCIYHEDAFRKRVRDEFLEVANKLIDFLRAGNSDVQRLVNSALSALMTRVLMLIPRFKMRAFEEEREWRIVVMGATLEQEVQHLCFRPGRRGVIPYLELAVDRADNLIPLTHVFVGPTVDPEAGVEAAQLLLDQRGYAQVKAEGSRIPYRASK